MKETRYYEVAGHVFGVTAEAEDFGLMGNYEAFGVSAQEPLFMLTIGEGEAVSYAEELRQEDEGQVIVCGSRITNATEQGSEKVFEFHWYGETAGWLASDASYRGGRLTVTGKHKKMAIDNALMIMFALATADKDTVLFHAAVVSHGGKGYMFLGKSGTGKSTHARLWLKYIEGTELVNDDNPVVRGFAVYGSPWSGKTPCYRNVSYPLGGIVLLSQAPRNRIEPLKGLQAYAALVPSISGMRWDEKVANGLHDTENRIATEVPMWYLGCLPDEEAARLCQTTIS